MKISENFDIREFVSLATWQKWGEKSIWFVREDIINACELLKKVASNEYGKASVYVNTWLWKGNYIGSGYREPHQYNKGQFKKNPNSESLHRQGCAADCKVKVGERYLSSTQMYNLVIRNKDIFRKYITALEDPHFTEGNTDWLHMDCRTSKNNDIIIVKP